MMGDSDQDEYFEAEDSLPDVPEGKRRSGEKYYQPPGTPRPPRSRVHMTAPPADEMADSDEQPLLAGALTHSLARGSSYLTCASRQDGTSSCAFDSSADREEARKTRNKLTAAICICCVFMCVEVTGGYLANSLAIMSDAVHLLSDVAGFAVALFAVWASSLPGGPRHSYGYHRMEILGALASISGIWAATAFLVYEAIGRVNTPAPVNGKLMLIVASMGVGVNLILLVILGGDHHHIGGNCSHSHGDGHGHGHDHAGHSHSHGEGGDGEGGGCWIHNHSDGHGHGHAGGSHSHAAGGGDGGGCLGHKHGGGGSDSHSHGHDHGAHAHEEGECSSHSHTHGEGGGCRVKEAPAPSHGHNHNHSHSHGHEHGHGSGQCSGHSHSHEHDHGEHAHEDGHGHGTGGNLNMRGAYLHALGDLVQSLGVAVAGAVIYVKPEWHIIDPICTFCFSVLVLATTSRIIRDIFDVLMQSAPRHISVADVQKRIEGGVEGVVGVHDLHIWSLTQSKTVMSLHIQVEPSVEQAEVVHSVHDFARSLGIGHVTVQVELVERGAGRPHVSDTQTVELDVEFGDMSSSPSGSSAEDV